MSNFNWLETKVLMEAALIFFGSSLQSLDKYLLYSLVFKELGEFEKAISCFKKAIQIRPSYIIAHQN